MKKVWIRDGVVMVNIGGNISRVKSIDDLSEIGDDEGADVSEEKD